VGLRPSTSFSLRASGLRIQAGGWDRSNCDSRCKSRWARPVYICQPVVATDLCVPAGVQPVWVNGLPMSTSGCDGRRQYVTYHQTRWCAFRFKLLNQWPIFTKKSVDITSWGATQTSSNNNTANARNIKKGTTLNSFIRQSLLRQAHNPLQNNFTHRAQSSAAPSNLQYPLLPLKPSSNYLRLLPRLPVTLILPSIFPARATLASFHSESWNNA